MNLQNVVRLNEYAMHAMHDAPINLKCLHFSTIVADMNLNHIRTYI